MARITGETLLEAFAASIEVRRAVRHYLQRKERQVEAAERRTLRSDTVEWRGVITEPLPKMWLGWVMEPIDAGGPPMVPVPGWQLVRTRSRRAWLRSPVRVAAEWQGVSIPANSVILIDQRVCKDVPTADSVLGARAEIIRTKTDHVRVHIWPAHKEKAEMATPRRKIRIEAHHA
jgi:hypothetical protein